MLCLQGGAGAGARGFGPHGQGSLSAGSASVDSQQQLLAHHQSVATLVPQGGGGYKATASGDEGYVPVALEQLEPGATVDANAGLAQYYANAASVGYGGAGGSVAPASPTANNTDYSAVRRLSMGARAGPPPGPSAAFNVGANGLPPNASLAGRRNASRPDLYTMQQQQQFNNLDGPMPMQQQQAAFNYGTLQNNRPTTYQAGGGGMGYARQQNTGLRPSYSMQWGPSASGQVSTSGLEPGNYAMRASQGNLGGGRFGSSQPSTPFGTLRRARYPIHAVHTHSRSSCTLCARTRTVYGHGSLTGYLLVEFHGAFYWCISVIWPHKRVLNEIDVKQLTSNVFIEVFPQ